MSKAQPRRLPTGPGLRRGREIAFTVDGQTMKGFLGETVATALMMTGDLSLRTTAGGEPRGLFCGIGFCFDCLVIVDGVPGTRACVTWLREGMNVMRQQGAGLPAEESPGSSES